jgi:hypothetical protein
MARFDRLQDTQTRQFNGITTAITAANAGISLSHGTHDELFALTALTTAMGRQITDLRTDLDNARGAG